MFPDDQTPARKVIAIVAAIFLSSDMQNLCAIAWYCCRLLFVARVDRASYRINSQRQDRFDGKICVVCQMPGKASVQS